MFSVTRDMDNMSWRITDEHMRIIAYVQPLPDGDIRVGFTGLMVDNADDFHAALGHAIALAKGEAADVPK